jgi:hypothetical protein
LKRVSEKFCANILVNHTAPLYFLLNYISKLKHETSLMRFDLPAYKIHVLFTLNVEHLSKVYDVGLSYKTFYRRRVCCVDASALECPRETHVARFTCAHKSDTKVEMQVFTQCLYLFINNLAYDSLSEFICNEMQKRVLFFGRLIRFPPLTCSPKGRTRLRESDLCVLIQCSVRWYPYYTLLSRP